MNKTIVVEFGSRFVRAGFASEANPRFITNSSGILEITDTQTLNIKLVELFQIIFINKLVVKPKEYSVLIVENLSCRRLFRNLLLTILFTEFQVISVSMQPDLFMGSLSSGYSSGVIIDIGHDSTQIICFDQGRPLLHTYKSAPVGVAHASDSFSFLLSKLLSKPLDCVDTEPLFEKLACNFTEDVPVDSIQAVQVYPHQNVSDNIFTLPSELRYQCLECLICGESPTDGCIDENGGAAGLLLRSLKACSYDVRSSVINNIIFCGGGALIAGLPEAVCLRASQVAVTAPEFIPQLAQVIQKLPSGKLTVLPSPFRRDWLVWAGASLFASVKSNFCRFARKSELRKTLNLRPGAFPSESGEIFSTQAPNLTQTPTLAEHKASSSNWMGERSRSNSVNSQRFLSPTKAVTSNTSSNNLNLLSSDHGTVTLYICPDWQSLDPADWIFWGPRAPLRRSVQPTSSTSPSKFNDLSRSSSLESFTNLAGHFTPKAGALGTAPRRGLGSVGSSPVPFSFQHGRGLSPRRSPIRSPMGVSMDLKPTSF